MSGFGSSHGIILLESFTLFLIVRRLLVDLYK